MDQRTNQDGMSAGEWLRWALLFAPPVALISLLAYMYVMD